MWWIKILLFQWLFQIVCFIQSFCVSVWKCLEVFVNFWKCLCECLCVKVCVCARACMSLCKCVCRCHCVCVNVCEYVIVCHYVRHCMCVHSVCISLSGCIFKNNFDCMLLWVRDARVLVWMSIACWEDYIVDFFVLLFFGLNFSTVINLIQCDHYKSDSGYLGV